MLAIRFRSALKSYDNFVLRNPLVGISLTTGIGMATGNFLCQSLMYMKQNKPISMHSLLQYATFGLFISVIYFKPHGYLNSFIRVYIL